MREVKTLKFGESFVKTCLVYYYFYMVIIKTYKVKKNLYQISGNFPRKIPNSQAYNILCAVCGVLQTVE